MSSGSRTNAAACCDARKAGGQKSPGAAEKLLSCLAVLVVCWLVPVGARAATFIVNVPQDGVDFSPGDGICETAPGNGICTLRAAIMEANRAPGSVVDLTLVAILDIPPSGSDDETTGDLNIIASVTIAGSGPTTAGIDANSAVTQDRAIRIEAGVVTVRGVTIQNGLAQIPSSSDPAAERGGALYVAPGSTLFLSNCVVSGSTATRDGGGLYVAGGMVSVGDSTFDGNKAWYDGGAIYKAAGALTVVRSTIGSPGDFTGGNDGGHGGGVYDAGGIDSTALIADSAVIGNGAADGGGLYLAGAGVMTIRNVTVSHNRAEHGPGIYAKSSGANRVVNSTIVNNGVGLPGSGGVHTVFDPAAPDALTLRNTIVAGNTRTEVIFNPCPPWKCPSGPVIIIVHHPADCSGQMAFAGNNLFGSFTCGEAGRVADPKLGPLQDNGGPTRTHALLEGSPAIDAVELDGCVDTPGAALATDQRGFARPDGGACDIGAFEASAPFQCLYALRPATVFVPTGATEGALSVLTSGSDCSWSADSSVSWLVVTSGHGTGNGSLTYTVAANPGGARSGAVLLTGSTSTVWQASHEATAGDFNGDRGSDLIVYRPSSGFWYVRLSGTGVAGAVGYRWGLSTDAPVPGDYDGDGRIDVTVYRPSSGHWFILKSSTNYTTWDTYQWGTEGDIPVPGDYDGDGTTDIAIYRPSDYMWYILQSSGGGAGYQWGWASGFVPVPADYDGDGKTDPAVYDPFTAQWHIRRSSDSTPDWSPIEWGATGDIPVPADYDGDRQADIAIYRPSSGMWYILLSTMGVERRGYPWGAVGYAWGAGDDIPVPADYDGDGTADIAVYRPSSGHWFILKSSTSFTMWDTYQWGSPGDVPAMKSP